MRETGEDFGEQDEDTEIQNLPLYTERKADGIYRYRRRVPKNLVEHIEKELPLSRCLTASSSRHCAVFCSGYLASWLALICGAD